MKLSERVLVLLEENRSCDLSGEAIAQRLGVSRNAVWKAVRALEAEGHRIEAATRRGYRLLQASPRLQLPQLAQQLADLPLFPELFSELPSTTSLLRERAEAGAPEGTLLITERQTGGYGRRGRIFYSPAPGGIYMSLLLRPTLSASEALRITTAAAVAVCRALEEHCGASPCIKWVNDIFCAEKKVCGIGTEGALDLESGGLRYALLGIGLNLYPSPEPIPAPLVDVVGTVLPAPPTDEGLRSRVLCAILREFFALYPALDGYFAAYERRCFVLGREAMIERGGESLRAQVLALNPDYSLQIRYPDGCEEALSTGEISLRPL